jgi:alkanesulfonate monooxygenase SsuD/methylene tetrahydromethanopterin reductase-like flavin-dependent oxidoreductase (luciferase family)
VTSFSGDVARNFSRENMPLRRALRGGHEFLEVTCKLWEGWQEGRCNRISERALFCRRENSGREPPGKYFQVQGPLNITRSPQGRPVIIAAGSSADGQKLAARTAEVVFTAAATLEEAQAFYRAQKQQVREAGRNPDHVLILPGVMPVVGRTREEARATWRKLNTLVDIDNGIRQLSTRFNMDLSQYPLGAGNPCRGCQVKLLTDLAYRENLTLRAAIAGSRGHRTGAAPRRISPMISSAGWNRAVRMASIMPAVMPEQLSLFVEMVIPELRRRGLFREEYEFSTLRENLGLPAIGA